MRLVVEEGYNRGAELALGERAVLGRGEECTLQLLDEGVSRRHVELERKGELLLVRDLQSRNGTRVNGVRVEEAEVAPGDRIAIGGVRLLVAGEPRGASLAERPTAELARGSAAPAQDLLAPGFDEAEILGDSPQMRTLLAALAKAAPTRATVLVQGESGTGKELVARAIHRVSPRRRGPFVVVNAPALPEQLVESEIFGHEKGAFTGALARKIGLAEAAHGGTLFLDELGELSPGAQAKLLRFLESGEVTRVGATQPVQIDARLVAATHRDLEALVREGKFREDLLYRLRVIELRVPPLREREGDVRLLATRFLERLSGGRASFKPRALDALAAHRWPGNVRELRNAVEAASILASTLEIDVDDLPGRVRGGEARSEARTLAEIEQPDAGGARARDRPEDALRQAEGAGGVIGSTLHGYTIGAKLGRGGMGAVYRGVDASGAAFAVKVIDARLADDPGARRRFEHECELLRELSHPRIVRAVTGLLEAEGHAFYVMELVQGEDLSSRLSRGPLPADEAVAIASDVLEALVFAHGRGVLHRDVKPSNVFMETAVGSGGRAAPPEPRRAKLGDFGLAHAAGQTRLTSTGAVVGTPEYMAPEQAEGLPLSERTDLYALGVLLYEALAGQPPFRAESPLAVLRMHVDKRPPPLPDTVSTALAAVVERALEKKPERRFASAREMLDALAAAKDARPAKVDAATLAKAETRELRPDPARAETALTLKPTLETARPERAAGRLLLLGVLGVALLGTAAFAARGFLEVKKATPVAPAGEAHERVVVDMKSGEHFEGELLELDLDKGVLVTRQATGEVRSTSLGDVKGYHKPEVRGEPPR